ncbi:MAG: hypothetical protein ACO1RX_14615 [Candidatus Sericytochromatia bacterium]
MKALKAFGVAPSELRAEHIHAMFELFASYYDNVSFDQFQKDLAQKDHVFLLKDKATLTIQGFSTIVALEITVKNRKVRGFFSGDTVIHQDYWGQGTLGVAFLTFLFTQKLKKPLQPLYWFLISKGYKSYLLMANNFPTYYPRYEMPTPPEQQQIIDAFSETLYAGYYNRTTGIISFGEDSKDHLKQDITPIDDSLLSNPRIAFFAERNPGWSQGDELACVAEMTFGMPVFYQLKLLKKMLSGRRAPSAKQTRAAEAKAALR